MIEQDSAVGSITTFVERFSRGLQDAGFTQEQCLLICHVLLSSQPKEDNERAKSKN